jgi:hypothetical protein
MRNDAVLGIDNVGEHTLGVGDGEVTECAGGLNGRQSGINPIADTLRVMHESSFHRRSSDS